MLPLVVFSAILFSFWIMCLQSLFPFFLQFFFVNHRALLSQTLVLCFAFMLHLMPQSGMFLEVTNQVSSMFPPLQHLQLFIFLWRAFSSLSWGATFLSWTGGHCWGACLLCDVCGIWTREKL